MNGIVNYVYRKCCCLYHGHRVFIGTIISTSISYGNNISSRRYSNARGCRPCIPQISVWALPACGRCSQRGACSATNHSGSAYTSYYRWQLCYLTTFIYRTSFLIGYRNTISAGSFANVFNRFTGIPQISIATIPPCSLGIKGTISSITYRCRSG